jgi:hypothetical protein
MRYKESLERVGSGVPHTAKFVDINGYAAAVWFSTRQIFPPHPRYPRWYVVFGNMIGVPNHWYYITMDGEIREQARGRLDDPLVPMETAKRVIAALVKAVHIEIVAQEPIIEAACAMFDSPKAGISQLKEAVRAYEEK